MNRLFVAKKPAGEICSRFLAKLKRKYNVKKAGFSGTLDPFASGVLLIGFGNYTKLFRFLEKSPKRYRATLWLGAKSETLDHTAISKVERIEPLSLDKIKKEMANLCGKVSYTPPKFSAKWIDGKRAYDLARRGKDFSLKACEMEIFEARALHFASPFLTFELALSEGGYVRSWAELLCERLGVSGCLSNLERMSEGKFLFDGEKPLDPREFLSVPFNRYKGDKSDFEVGKKIYKNEFFTQTPGVYAVDFGEFLSFVEISADDERVFYIINGVELA